MASPHTRISPPKTSPHSPLSPPTIHRPRNNKSQQKLEAKIEVYEVRAIVSEFYKFRRRLTVPRSQTTWVSLLFTWCTLPNHTSRPILHKGEEPPESLFMKELKRRGTTPTSLLEEKNMSIESDDQMNFKEEDQSSRRNAVKTDSEINLFNQREQSMALNSEGLEVVTFSALFPFSKLNKFKGPVKVVYGVLGIWILYLTWLSIIIHLVI